jgi:lipid II:glycine glycyltransferase (peptidoglycan interpeptide bridge formation enzyme)
VPELDPGYSVEVDQVDETTWYQLLDQFADANIYQTWAYGLIRSGQRNSSHLLLKRQGRVVAIAQCRIVKVPVLGVGIAYVMWGPLWKLTNVHSDPTVLRQAIRALRNEYARKRGLLVRLYPVLFEEEHGWVLPILEEEGFARASDEGRTRTILMDLTPSLDELHERLLPHWRRELKVASKQDIEITEGPEDYLFENFIEMYKEMVARKKFQEPNNIYEFQDIQRRLPTEYKMRLILCRSSDGDCAGLICSAIGSTAVYLFGATTTVGLKRRGSYLLQWRLIQRLQETQVPQYDLNGINPETNAGTYKFKKDLAGEKGRAVSFLGRFDSCENRLSLACVTAGEKLKRMRRALA